MHDLALLVSKSDILALDGGSAEDDTACIRHLNLIYYFRDEPALLDFGARKLPPVFSRGSAITELPASIGKLKLLRISGCLDVSRTRFQAFLESIIKHFPYADVKSKWMLVHNLEEVKDREEAEKAKLYRKANMKTEMELTKR
ncbi:hypothetical protein SADUNF_Sadunf16G0115800 [Salix dunnii]|uniref:Uncharacterized protein n=1 Tax=Salix dunnii TaxID=1413687 RepID=A0A835J6A1_9ROSI|nr:hypothetical protein SADUNF_Sadunf16G0115800 [Salix dunnii]